MARIFHFITESDLEEFLSNGKLTLPSIESQGFIHCSTAEQVTHVANTILPGREDLVLLEIEGSKVIPKIIYENLDGGENQFPHVYGPLNEDAIVSIHPFLWHKENGYILPVI